MSMNQFYDTNFVQPFFEQCSNNYSKRPMRGMPIDYFYSFTVPENRACPVVVPDSVVDVFFVCDTDFPRASIQGSITKGIISNLRPGETVFGVRYRPGACPYSMGIMGNDILNDKLYLDIFPGGTQLIESIECAKTFAERASLFIHSDVSRNIGFMEESSMSRVFTGALAAIFDQYGDIALSELEAKTGYSTRYLNKVFKKCSGISPKTFCKIVRFQRLLHTMNGSDKRRLTDIAMDAGYYDQSHMLKEFREYTTMTPSEYKKMCTVLK